MQIGCLDGGIDQIDSPSGCAEGQLIADGQGSFIQINIAAQEACGEAHIGVCAGGIQVGINITEDRAGLGRRLAS